MEQVLDEADAATGSTPEPSDAQQVEQTAETTASDSPSAEVRARPAAEEVDRDAIAFARLTAGETKESIRQNPDRVAPSTDAGPQDESREGTAEPKAAKATTTPTTAYEGLDEKSLGTLRRAQLLPEPEVWKITSQKGRQSMLTTAKRLLQERGRIGQQIGQQRQQAADDIETTDDATDTQGDDEIEQGEDLNGTVDDPPRTPPQQRQQGVRAQTQPPARVEAQPEVEDAFKAIREFVGDDAVKPLAAMFANQQQALVQSQQQNQTLQAQMQGMARQFFLPQEQAGFEKLAAKAGDIPEPKREMIRHSATGFFEAASRAGEHITWQQAIERAGYAVLNPDIEQQAQQKLLNRRADSLRATPTKGAPARPDRALAKEDRDARAYEMLVQGRSREETRSALY